MQACSVSSTKLLTRCTVGRPTPPRRPLHARIKMTGNVQEYIDKHNLQKRVEDVLNACVKAKPEEPMSYMVGPLVAMITPWPLLLSPPLLLR